VVSDPEIMRKFIVSPKSMENVNDLQIESFSNIELSKESDHLMNMHPQMMDPLNSKNRNQA